MNITIRQLQPADRLAYRRTRLACLREFPESFASSYEEEGEKQQLYFEGRIEAQAANAFMLGAFDNESLVGICGFIRESGIKTRHWGELLQVYVQPAYSGRGVGRRLLQAAIEQAFKEPSLEQIQLGVVAGNTAANALYERLGFKEYGFLKDSLRVNGHHLSQRFMVLTRSAASRPSLS